MAFIGIHVPEDIARVLSKVEVPGNRTHPADMHITMAFLGSNTPAEQLIRASAACVTAAAKQKSFKVGVARVTTFPGGEDGVPVIGRVISAQLASFRASLCTILDSAGVEYSKKFAYSPHITLAYAESAVEDFDIEPVTWTVNRLTLWGGDDGDERYVTEVDLG